MAYKISAGSGASFRSLGRGARFLLFASVALVATQCLSWETWDVKFKSSKGWAFGDGAYSVHLPRAGAPKGSVPGGSSGRHYFFFGDSWMWRSDLIVGPGFVHKDADNLPLPFKNNWLLPGSTAAILTYTANAAGVQTPGSINFFSRRRPSALTGDCTAALCPIVNLDSVTDPTEVQNAGGFLPRPQPCHWHYWPLDAVYVENPSFNLPPGYAPPSPMSASEPFLALGYATAAFRPEDRCGVPQWGYTIATNVHQELGNWNFANAAVRPFPTAPQSGWNWPLWGAALVHHPGDDKVRIYGVTQKVGTQEKNAVLAVAWPSMDIASPSRWNYLYRPGALGCGLFPCFQRIEPNTLARVALLQPVAQKVTSDFSVDYVCHNEPAGAGPAVNACAFVMIHGTFPEVIDSYNGVPAQDPGCQIVDPNNARWAMIRTTNDDTQFPPPRQGSFGSTSTRIRDDLVHPQWDRAVLCDASDPLKNRAVRQLRGQDGIREPGMMAVSYYVGIWPPPPHIQEHLFVNGVATTEANRKSNVRFGKFPLNMMRPWCTASKTCP